MTKISRYTMVWLSALFWPIGLLTGSYNCLLISVVLFWGNNIVFAFEKVRRRIVFLIFHVTFAVFLLSRPVISACKGDVWWYFENEHVLFALQAMILSLIFLFIGALLVERRIDSKKIEYIDTARAKYSENFKQSLQIISGIIFYTSFFFYIAMELEKLIFVRQGTYLDYYTSFQSTMPYMVYIISRFMPYSLCVYLATMPPKKKAVPVLVLYVLSAVPSLMIGVRNPIGLNILFGFVYFLIRDIFGDNRKWIGKAEKIAIVTLTPCALVFLGAYNYIRDGAEVEASGIFGIISDFFYKQGVTFDVLSIGHAAIPQLPDRPFRNYTFGGFLDYILHGTVAQKLFGAQGLEAGNNMTMALLSNSFAHNMSYVSRGQEYLDGHGWGSSFLLETYADFGYIGIILFSLILGAVLVYMLEFAKKGSFRFTLVLVSLTSVFFVPRAEATGWLNFLITAQFWACLLPCWFTAGLITKRYSNQLLIPRRRKQNV